VGEKGAEMKSNLVFLAHPEFDFNQFLLRIMAAMRQTNMSNYDLAHSTNLCTSTICRIMGKRSKNMQVGTVSKIAQALKVSSDYLLGVRAARTIRERGIEEDVLDFISFQQKRA
jgi:predicted transcriptional regulator